MSPKKVILGKRGRRSMKQHCARMIPYPESSLPARSETAGPSSSEPGPSMLEPGPSSSELGPSGIRAESLADQQKIVRAANLQHKKNVASQKKLTPYQRRLLANLKDQKQVKSFMMPDAPESKKGKGKGRGKGQGEETRRWVTCPLLPGVPTSPPPKIPQPWEMKSKPFQETEAEAGRACQATGTPLLLSVPGPLMERAEEEEEEYGESIIEVSLPSSFVFDPDHLLGTMRKAKGAHGPITSSLGAPPQAKKQKLLLSPTSDPVIYFEFQGFTPSSTTSEMPGSGGSATASEIGVNFESKQDVAEDLDVNAGSDLDADADTDFVNISLRQRDVFEFPSAFEEAGDISDAMQQIDTEADSALRALIGSEEYLHFDWRGEAEHFQGVREEFTGPSGPTFDISGLTPLAIFKKIWDADIIAHIVRETNNYASQLQHQLFSRPKSRLSRWRNTTEDEIWTLLGILMLQSLVINNVEREYWYPRLEQLRIGTFKDIMSFDRFCLLKKCLHFVDNASLPESPNKLHKIMPVIEHLNKKFSSLYLPEQNVAIDESLLLWKGRLSFAQLIATKRARVGIKSYELCESRTGYLWKMEVYMGKGHVHAPQKPAQEAVEGHNVDDELGSATSQIVFSLMRPLFNRGHTLVMDNFYNSPLLSRLLKAKHKTDSMGTLRINRESVPESLKGKNKNNMQTGEVCFSCTNDLSVLVWMDKSPVSMLSTYHKVQVGGKEKYGYYKYKPEVVLDYNLSMGGIDHKDQMLHAYPVERIRNMVWYKKLFRRLVNVSIHNALVMFNHEKQIVGNRDFRLALAEEILQVHRPQSVPRPLAPAKPTGVILHMPIKNVQQQRCKLCTAAKVRRTTMWSCRTCKVNLCIEGCYNTYHNSA